MGDCSIMPPAGAIRAVPTVRKHPYTRGKPHVCTLQRASSRTRRPVALARAGFRCPTPLSPWDIIAPKRAYMETPLLCATLAKRDDFEAGQCSVSRKGLSAAT